VTLSPVWFDPGEVVGQLTPFWVLYALHDALVKPINPYPWSAPLEDVRLKKM
jgi:peptide/nickel transport system substrate-binding protein